MEKQDIKANFAEAYELLARFYENDNNIEAIEQAAQVMVHAVKNGGKLISCGNGGSMADAMHFAEELTGRFRENRPALPAISISDPTHMSCVGNDYGYDHIFSKFVEALGQSNDVLLGISTSGNSANVLLAAKAAKKKGMKVVTLTGKDGGALAEISDIEIRVPHFGYADRIQEIHIKIIHSLIQYIEAEMN